MATPVGAYREDGSTTGHTLIIWVRNSVFYHVVMMLFLGYIVSFFGHIVFRLGHENYFLGHIVSNFYMVSFLGRVLRLGHDVSLFGHED